MDNPNGASNNDTNQQLSGMSAPIVSTLTTATPITSEVVSDFEPDPKFEITTLEMASYDCQDIYTSTNLREEHNPGKLSANHADSGEIQDISQQQTNNLVQAEQVILVAHGDSHDVIESHASLEQLTSSNFDETPRNSEDTGSKSLVEQQEQVQQKHANLNINADASRPNDCKSSQVAGGDFESASSSVSFAQVEPNAKPDSNVTMHSSKIVNTNYDKPRGFEFDTSAELSSSEQALKNSDNLTAFSLSQTSVDAQMEKVIDNIVELGGVHQFPQSFGHPEGREEILASIHREITSERSSIDLIADVASRQKSIEIDPIMDQQQQQQQQNSNSEKKESDIISMDTLDKETVDINNRADITANSAEFRRPEEATDEMLIRNNEEVDDTKMTNEEITQTNLIQDNIVDESLIQEVVTDEKANQEEITEVHVPEQDVIERIEDQVKEEAKHETKDEPKNETKEEPKNETKEEPKHETKEEPNVEAIMDVKEKTRGKRILERCPRSLRPRDSLKRTHVDDTPQENPPKAEPPKKQLKKSRGSTSEAAPMIKLPNFRSRSTISTSDPISRLDKNYETTKPTSVVQIETEKRFKCHQCGYATDRLNNLVYHSTKSFCTGKCQIGEVMKADIIKQQQQAKNKRRSIR